MGIIAAILLVASLVAEYLHAPAWLIFCLACGGLIPLAGILGKATEEVAIYLGPGVGGFLNATFGNATELIIAILALQKGLVEMVKASVTGSIIGNLLLVLGVSVVAGGVKYKSLKFNPANAGMANSMMLLAVLGLLIPAVYSRVPHPAGVVPTDTKLYYLTLWVAGVLMLLYLLGLVFSLVTHRDIFNPVSGTDQHETPEWSLRTALVVMLVATLLVIVQSEILVGTLKELLETFPIPEIFLGVIVVAVVGNAAEHAVAVLVAMRNQMDLAFQIACGSSTQVALFVAPVLVFVGAWMGVPMDLNFSLLEVVAVVISTFIVGTLAQDAEFNWFEGAQLLGVYLILALTFYFY
ncbi:MAG: calcium/proton exchanger [Armatimonadetes bacterium]|nr:calcium/proton exchanger [Armatimonadota bacterium]